MPKNNERIKVKKARNENPPIVQADTIKVSADSIKDLVEGQHVIVYEVLDKNVVSYRTGRNMGAKEKILTKGIVKRDKNSLVVQVASPLTGIETISVKKRENLFSRLGIGKDKSKQKKIYMKAIKE